MKIKIQRNESKDYKIISGKNQLIISDDSTDWSNSKITQFLLNLAAESVEDEPELDIDLEARKIDKIYDHICTLFEIFIDEYMNTKGN